MRNVRDALHLTFLRQLLRTPEGRRHLLTQVADAEHTGEARVFDAMLDFTKDDEKLARTIAKHRDDEVRHERLFRACAERQGVPPREVPPELGLMDALEARVGFSERAIVDGRGVMDAYLVLQVLEERAVAQFDLFIDAFREMDPETARVFEEVARDEARHLRYCHAIARRYAPDDATRAARLAELRAIEADITHANQIANLRYILAEGYVDGAARRLALRVLGEIASRVSGPPFTPIARAERSLAA
ncbi:MAG: ferritin-like domain-containing protein [Polyangiaceae bacterium]